MSERKLINATSTDAVCIESTGESRSITAAGWQWLNYRDEALRVPRLIGACQAAMEALVNRGGGLFPTTIAILADAIDSEADEKEASEQSPRFVQGHVE